MKGGYLKINVPELYHLFMQILGLQESVCYGRDFLRIFPRALSDPNDINSKHEKAGIYGKISLNLELWCTFM